MFICLSHWSALECWRRIRQCGNALVNVLLTEKTSQLPQNIAPAITSREADKLAKDFGLSLPLQLSTPHGFRRRPRDYCAFLRLRQGAEIKDVCEIEEGVYLPRPETVFIQMAQFLDAIDLARLGYELSSSYVLVGTTIMPSQPLIHPELLKAESLSHSKRTQKAIERTLGHFIPGAESPAEIDLALKLFLPTFYGGLGFKGAQLNPVLPLSNDKSEIAGKSYCRADIFFKDSKLDIEYDSDQWHGSEQKQTEDLKRRLVLQQEGYRVMSVARTDVNTPANLNKLGLQIAAVRKKRLRLSSPDFENKQRKLFNRLGPSLDPLKRP